MFSKYQQNKYRSFLKWLENVNKHIKKHSVKPVFIVLTLLTYNHVIKTLEMLTCSKVYDIWLNDLKVIVSKQHAKEPGYWFDNHFSDRLHYLMD